MMTGTRGILGRWGSAVAGLLLLVSTAEAQRISPSGGSTTITTSTATDLTGLLLGNGADVDAYAGTSCTNQFPRSLNASGVATCASVANADLAGSIAASKLVGTDIATVGTITTGTWNAGAVTSSGSVQAASGSQLLISTDTGIRRDAAGSLSFTNGSTGHATGLGLGTVDPFSVNGAALLNQAINVKGASAGFIAEGTAGGTLTLNDSDAAANARSFFFRSQSGTGEISRLNDAATTIVQYLSANLATDVLQIGSASVAGVNYISGTGDHVFSDGDIKLPDYSGTGAATLRGTTHTTYGIGIDSAGIVHVNADSSGGELRVGGSTGTRIFFGAGTGFGISGAVANAGGFFWDANIVAPARVGVAADNGIDFGSASFRWKNGYFGTSIGVGTLYAAAPIGTVASGTGVTVNATGDYRRVINKVTLTYAAWAAAATTADKTIYTLAAKQRLVGILADVTATFTGGAVSDADMTCGKTAGGNEYLVSFDVDTATGTYGDADAELGTAINRAGAIQGGDLPSWSATTALTCRLTTVGANTDALTAGSITFYLITEMM